MNTILPLSINQRDIYIDQMMWDDGSHLNIGAVGTIIGTFDVEIFNYSINQVIAHSPALRSRIYESAGQPLQVIMPHQDEKITLIDFSNYPDSEERAKEYIKKDFSIKFSFAENAPLAYFKLIRVSSNKHLWYGKFHHTITDGWGTSLFFNKVISAYNKLIKNNISEQVKEDYTVDYALVDYLKDESAYLESNHFAKDGEYWSKRLQKISSRLFPPAKQPQLTGNRRSIYISREKYNKASEICQDIQSNSFHFLLGLLFVYFARRYRQNDLVVGLPLLNRSKKAYKDAIALFISMMPFKMEVNGNETFSDLLIKIRSSLRQDYRHQRYPLGEMKRIADLHSENNKHIFEVSFSYEKHDYSESFGDTQTTCVPLYSGQQKLPLAIYVREFDDISDVKIDFDYNLSYIDSETIEQMVEHFQNLLDDALENFDKKISQLSVTLPHPNPNLNKQKLKSLTDYREAETLISAFSKSVNNYPQLKAVQFDNNSGNNPEKITLTYAELDARANCLARYLQTLGVKAEARIGLCLERSENMVVAILGILKAGAAYVPLDPNSPSTRLEFILEDSGVSLLIAEESIIARLTNDKINEKIKAFSLQSIASELAQQLDTPLEISVNPESAAYVIYTSGSTGTPKGCVVSHANVIRLMRSVETWFDFNEKDVWTMFHSFAFDFSVWELWGALLYGGKVIVVPFWLSRSPEDFHNMLSQEGVTVLSQTPSAFRQLIRANETSIDNLALRYVIFGGEALDLQSLRSWFEKHGDQSPRLINMYGITETTVHVTYRPITLGDVLANRGSVIGETIPDLDIYLLDENLQLVPQGFVGEIYVAGAGVTRGYLNRPALTAERFLPNPFGEGRLYRSGDLARLLSNGDLEYLGRIDHQVKIRGFRIELGEIQSALASHPQVGEAFVTTEDIGEEDKRLVAYYVLGSVFGSDNLTVNDLRLHLKSALPDYMVPTAYVSLDAFPLTVNGKIDTKALPKADFNLPEREVQYIAPRNQTEERLCNIWLQVLAQEQVGIDDNFFEIGGDSILAMQVVAQAHTQDIPLSIKEIYENPTVRQLAALFSLSLENTPLKDAMNRVSTQSPQQSPQQSLLLKEEDQQRLPLNAVDAYPLSSLQAGMLYYNELHPGSAIFHDIFTFRLRLPYSETAWRKALSDICEAHAVLRTSFHWTGYSTPLQIVHQQVELPLTIYDLRSLETTVKSHQVQEWVESEKTRPFDVTNPPLFRFVIHRFTDSEISLSFSFHHAILDGWSVATLITQLLQLYIQYVEGSSHSTLATPNISYKDFIAQEQASIASSEMREFWSKRLAGLEDSTLPRTRQITQKTGSQNEPIRKVESLNVKIEDDLVRKLQKVASIAGVPLKTVLMSAHLRVLAFLTGHDDVVTGNVLNGRPEKIGSENLLGLFLNTAPLRMKLTPSSWLDLIKTVFSVENEIIPYRCFPLLEIQRLVEKSPLFDVGFNFVHFHVYDSILDLPQIEVLGVDDFEETNFPLAVKFSLIPRSASLRLELVYDVNQFDLPQVEQYGKYYQAALSGLATNPQAEYHSQSLMSPEEKNKWLLDANCDVFSETAFSTLSQETTKETTKETIVSVFAKVAAQYQQKAAVSFGDITLNYGELDAKSNRLAHYLISKGVSPNTLVGVSLERSHDLVVTILAVLKAGGAYVPIDPSYPSERIDFLLRDSGISLLITQQEAITKVSSCKTEIVVIEEIDSQLENYNQELPEVAILPEHPAYVIYTSGSTGTPKGCVVNHANVVRLLKATETWYGFNSDDVWTLFHSYAFDFSVWEIWGALLYGGKVVVVPYWTSRSPRDFWHLLQSEKVTVLNQTPSAFKQLIQADAEEAEKLESLRYVIFGGEALELQSLQPWFSRYGDQKPQLINMYGITETTVHVTYRPISQADLTSNRGSVIGQPIPDVTLYLLDKYLEPVPNGVAGELFVGGAGVTQGYLHHPRLSAERFIPDPFAKIPGSRLYRSGDLARRLPDGELEYLGRLDHQVKIRGFRIELGEIEAAISSHPQVKAACVTIRTESQGNARIVAYFVSEEKDDLVIALRNFLQARLPDYMMPSALIAIDTIPLTNHGKVDQSALPVPDWTQSIKPYVTPRNEVETTICSLMAELLELEKVGVMDNFFDIGGDSIRVTQLVTRLREIYKAELSLPEVFYNGTPEALAGLIAASKPVEAVSSIPKASRSRRSVNLGNDGSLV
ncbi:MAG: amino acid adenylation domain-containing protein [Scytonematopsis contorta HA4267-MV1]|jgi:amino acid adenylation domain-containing protein|nr:amino acid adenylation domain-containing protein [Scytonematopsis contorta HA4267-MV1]